MNMFHIKICGVRNFDDISAVSESGADAIGLNFFPPSVRYVSPEEVGTQDLSVRATELGLKVVGVFVNERPQDVGEVARRVAVDVIQLHGDEDIDEAREIRDRCALPLLRAIKLPVDELTAEMIEERSRPWAELGTQLLFDADAGRAHGGSGKQLDWGVIRDWADSNRKAQWGPTVGWTLAGGLTPGNVAEAIATSHANSVDTASGVEEPKGVKSAEKIRRFVTACKSAE